MDKWDLAKKLYAAGYEHREVRSVWAYAWNEQHVGRSQNKRKPWQQIALERVDVSADEIEFDVTDKGELTSYF